MSHLFFSIIIPTYNRAAFIEKTLRSVFSQTYDHFEIIIVDDCSTDNTEEVLRPFLASGKVRVIKHDQNYERAHSRNRGMEAARGDFVTFLDSDDLMYPENLADAAGYAQSHPDIKCFHNMYEFINEAGVVVYRPSLPSLRDQIKAIVRGNFMACIGDFIHRDIYTQYRFDTAPELIRSEDWDFWLRVLAKHRVGRIERVNNGVVQHGGRSLAAGPDVASMERLRAGLERMAAKIAADPELAEVYRPHLKRLEANTLTYLAIMANGGLKHQTALGYLRRAVAKDFGVIRTKSFIRSLQIALFRMDTRRA